MTEGNGRRLRFLISYWYYRNVDIDQLLDTHFGDAPPELFADSGAFSAMTQNGKVDIDEYAAWVKRWRHRFTTYANLDEIMSAEATWRNQQYLEDKHGLTPLPAFHVREDFSWLERYVDHYPYIALGVAGMQKRKGLMPWLVRCFQIAGKQSVFHGFGLTSWKVMCSFPWYSVDSSTWTKGFRFGEVVLFDEGKRRFVIARLGDVKSCFRYRTLFEQEGFDWRDFADRERNDRKKVCAISALSFINAEQWLRRYWGEIRIPTREDVGTGMKMYIVTHDARNSAAPQNNGGNTSLRAIAESGIGTHLSAGPKLYLVASSNKMVDIYSVKEALDA